MPAAGEFLTLLLQSFEDVSNEVEQATVEDEEDFVGSFVYRLLPPEARSVASTMSAGT